jgi:thiamine-monophosphate kinase
MAARIAAPDLSTLGEFALIARYFKRQGHPLGAGVALGVGDDCALLQPGPGMQLAVSCDMLVSGRHFFPDVDPRTLGHKALAVNLSDLAACGAKPLGFSLALALPDANAGWLAAFSEGLFSLADAHACTLVGGDTTRGPLTICITVFGEVPTGQALLRSGANAGDDIYVSGTLGDAALALLALQGKVHLTPDELSQTRQRLETPIPRVALGMALRGIASAAVDVSDGLLGDLGHILEQSGKGAILHSEVAMQLIAVCRYPAAAKSKCALKVPTATLLQCALAGGDDYELVFTAAPEQRGAVQQAAHGAGVPVTAIGSITAPAGLTLLDAHGAAVSGATFSSFDHFAA